MKTINYLSKLSITILVLIALEAVITVGEAFNFSNYGIITTIVQVCLLIICIRVSLEKWTPE